jgi:UDP-2,3-diacylglucosamine pyrophosphatase LpxH
MKFTEKGMTFERLDDHRRRALRVSFDSDSSRFIMLSDAHKWDRSEVDFFNQVEPVYLGALDFYNSRQFTLILLGDIEEGAGDMLPDVLKKYPETFAKEKEFLPDRYIRVYGNHDHDWKKDDVRKLLDGVMDSTVNVWPALLLGDKIMVVHGHEGDLFSDELHGFTQILLRGFKKAFEMLLGHSPSAAENSRIRSRRASLLYKWGKRNGMIVVAGHTHLAYFESISITRLMHKIIHHLEETLKDRPLSNLDNNKRDDLGRRKNFMMAHDRFWEKNESLPEGALPLYFNSGCCKYEDGLTGIEVSEGKLALVKWTAVAGTAPERKVLASRQLSDIWAGLRI